MIPLPLTVMATVKYPIFSLCWILASQENLLNAECPERPKDLLKVRIKYITYIPINSNMKIHRRYCNYIICKKIASEMAVPHSLGK